MLHEATIELENTLEVFNIIKNIKQKWIKGLSKVRRELKLKPWRPNGNVLQMYADVTKTC